MIRFGPSQGFVVQRNRGSLKQGNKSFTVLALATVLGSAMKKPGLAPKRLIRSTNPKGRVSIHP